MLTSWLMYVWERDFQKIGQTRNGMGRFSFKETTMISCQDLHNCHEWTQGGVKNNQLAQLYLKSRVDESANLQEGSSFPGFITMQLNGSFW